MDVPSRFPDDGPEQPEEQDARGEHQQQNEASKLHGFRWPSSARGYAVGGVLVELICPGWICDDVEFQNELGCCCLTDRASAAATCSFGHYLTFL
jgi:hypothetical protein